MGIQMKQNEPTKTLFLNEILKKRWCPWFIQNYFSVVMDDNILS